jgi:hypothetical protein
MGDTRFRAPATAAPKSVDLSSETLPLVDPEYRRPSPESESTRFRVLGVPVSVETKPQSSELDLLQDGNGPAAATSASLRRALEGAALFLNDGGVFRASVDKMNEPELYRTARQMLLSPENTSFGREGVRALDDLRGEMIESLVDAGMCNLQDFETLLSSLDSSSTLLLRVPYRGLTTPASNAVLTQARHDLQSGTEEGEEKAYLLLMGIVHNPHVSPEAVLPLLRTMADRASGDGARTKQLMQLLSTPLLRNYSEEFVPSVVTSLGSMLHQGKLPDLFSCIDGLPQLSRHLDRSSAKRLWEDVHTLVVSNHARNSHMSTALSNRLGELVGEFNLSDEDTFEYLLNTSGDETRTRHDRESATDMLGDVLASTPNKELIARTARELFREDFDWSEGSAEDPKEFLLERKTRTLLLLNLAEGLVRRAQREEGGLKGVEKIELALAEYARSRTVQNLYNVADATRDRVQEISRSDSSPK